MEKVLIRTEFIIKECCLIKEWDSKPILHSFSGKGAGKQARQLTYDHNKKVWANEISGPIWTCKRHCIYGYVVETL